MTIPKKVQEKKGIKEEDIVGFYEEDGRVFVKKIHPITQCISPVGPYI